MKRLLLFLQLALALAAPAQYVTLTGTLQSANGLTAGNYTLAMKPSQFFYIAGSGVVVNSTVFCATDALGATVGTHNPTNPLVINSRHNSGSLPAAVYSIKYAWRDASGNQTQTGASQSIQVPSNSTLLISPPTSGMPANAAGMDIYIGTAAGQETLQGTTTGTAVYAQSTPITTTEANAFGANTTVCRVVANDAGWPTGTSYAVTMSDLSGNVVPGYPMSWRLLGPNTTLDLSQGLPTYNGLVSYPSPILATPLNHATQSISGHLSLGGFSLLGAGSIGVGTAQPAYSIDVQNGFINSNLGYLINGATGNAGQCPLSGGPSGPMSWGNCITSVPTPYYQYVQYNGITIGQEPQLDFSNRFMVANNGVISTNVDLATTVTAGSCTFCNLSFDQFGRITASGNGTAAASQLSTPNGYVTLPGGAIEEWMVGYQQSDVSGGGNSAETLTFPLTCPTSVLGFPQVTALTNGETMGDDTHGPTYAVVSYTRSSVIVQRYRLADHGSDPSTPIVWIICN